MFKSEICKILGRFFLAYAVVLLLPLAVCLYHQYWVDPALHPQPYATQSFLGTILICLALGLLFVLLGRKVPGPLYWREGLILAVLIWLIAAAIGALPFVLSGTLQNPVQAYFEAVSAFTTTGASVIAPQHEDPNTGEVIPSIPNPVVDPETHKVLYDGIEAVGQGLLFWRCFMQWLGGIGIVVLFIAVLPLLGIGGKVLLFSEIPGPIKSIWTPRMKEAIAALIKIYCGLTVIEVVLLYATHSEIGWIEALNITFSTLSTGGFSTRNNSIGAYHAVVTEWIVVIFMLLGSLNFTLYYQVLQGRLYRLWDVELLIYTLTVICGSALVAWYIVDLHHVSDSVRASIFQFVSTITTTGFYTVNYDIWPSAVQLVLLIAMFLGGMSGSTAGGMKTIRQYIGFHVIKNHVESMFRPGAMRVFRVGGRQVDTSVASLTLSFLIVLVFFSTLGWLLLVLDGMEIWSGLSAVASCVNNVGIGFGSVGISCSFGCLSNYQLAICAVLMLLGRLEFFAFLVLFVPAFWRHQG